MSGSKSSLPSDSNVARVPEPSGDQPLGFTVHSLPQMDAQSLERASSTRSARIKLLLLLLVSAAPVIASYFTYYVIRPEGRRNHGELIEPQRPLPDIVGTNLKGVPLALPQLRHQWLLVSVADSVCDQACEKHLFLSRQLRESLGKDKERMDWVWLHTGSSDVPATLVPALSAATVLKVDTRALSEWLVPSPGRRLEDHLYVVDPMGNWMMRFPADVDPVKARKDLERLMRSSSSWDQAGRP